MVVGCGHHVDQPCYYEGDGEPPPYEVSSEVDILVGPPKDQGEQREQENDAQFSVLMGGGGIDKSHSCSSGSTSFLKRSEAEVSSYYVGLLKLIKPQTAVQ